MKKATTTFRGAVLVAAMLILGSGAKESAGATAAQTLRCADCIQYQLVLVTPLGGYSFHYEFIKWRHEMMGTDCEPVYASHRPQRVSPLIRLVTAVQGEPWEEELYWDEMCVGCGVTSSCDHGIEDGECHVDCSLGEGEQQQNMTSQLRAGVKGASAEEVVEVIRRYRAIAHFNPSRNAVQLKSLCNPDGPLVDQVRMDPALARRVEALLTEAE